MILLVKLVNDFNVSKFSFFLTETFQWESKRVEDQFWYVEPNISILISFYISDSQPQPLVALYIDVQPYESPEPLVISSTSFNYGLSPTESSQLSPLESGRLPFPITVSPLEHVQDRNCNLNVYSKKE
jgi:hypothetical protein